VKPPRIRRRLLLALGWSALLGGAARAQAQGLGTVRESAVKAAFLYKFGNFVEWPAEAFGSPAAALVIGVFGDDAVASELEQITGGRVVEGHPVRVLRVRDRQDLVPMHILYAGGPREGRSRELLAAARGPVLTVADGPIGGEPGPVLFFTRDEGRVRFGASLSAAAARRLKLSSRLLAVAQHVEGR
jgi:hypothetical protein